MRLTALCDVILLLYALKNRGPGMDDIDEALCSANMVLAGGARHPARNRKELTPPEKFQWGWLSE